MKLLLITTFVCSVTLATAQVPDTSRSLRSPRTYGTDSVKQGQEIYNGGKSRKSKSNGDTLSRPRSNSKSGSMNSKPQNSGKK